MSTLRIILTVGIIAIIIGVGVGGYVLLNSKRTISSSVKPTNDISSALLHDKPTTESPEPKKQTTIFGGDVMLSRVVGQQLVKRNDYAWPFRELAPLMSSADITAINLESPFSKTGDHVVLTGSFSFDADPRAVAGLTLAGVDVATLANNHFGNQGIQGMRDSFAILKDAGIEYAGAGNDINEAHQPVIIERDGVRYGFLSYAYPEDMYVASETTPGVANMNIDLLKKDVIALRPQVDIVVVQMHAGTEYVTEPNWQQTGFARAAADAGADLVIGHHPHWVQTTEIYQGKPIIYSLGNLVFDQMFSRETQQGALAKVTVENKKISQIEIIPIRIYEYGQPRVITDEVERMEVLKRMGLEAPFVITTK
ncbi:MAG: CapA family protein [Candidatus Buchananbacteria bacterium]|nr:CapA family protein [Candidatus Buchananbacteria bacterium]